MPDDLTQEERDAYAELAKAAARLRRAQNAAGRPGAKPVGHCESQEAVDAPPSLRALLEYEVKSSWWAGCLSSEAMQDAAATYYAWKVKRKYARFQASTKKPTADKRF